ncbi:hypothetical protein [Marinobacter zhanjiangensis]|uniref:Uncharacterized protein n=1 Tax=Marinobacter zhanjiangensis TaxID=578215 RepID=A0ABQ3BBB7_9GAMM|nr:hypothetical protein [Marinobacter zhanjiangensis]GGY86096.1 hypothetical protein GCM10007071_37000 [Marinobacter zhanjiangensis]
MSRALAFVTGIAVIIVVLLVLFTPDSDPQTGTPDNGAETDSSGNGSERAAPAANKATVSGQNPGEQSSKPAEPVSRWPDPDDTSALPARPDNPARNARPLVSLWQAGSNPTKTEVDGFPATRLKADPQALAGLHVGQQVALQVPDLNRTVTARLTTTHNQLNNIEVFRGPVTGGHKKDNVIVTRGNTSTYVVVNTREGVYSAVIDNRTGDAVLTSEKDVQDNLAGEQDAIPVPGVNQTPPGTPSG